MKWYSHIFIFLLSFYFTYAQVEEKYRVSGIVYGIDTSDVIPGAMIVIDTLGMGAVSGPKGMFVIDGVPKGEYNIEIRITGKQPVKRYIKVYGDSIFKIQLPPENKELPSVVIVSGAYYKIKENPGAIYYTPTEKAKEFLFLDPVRTLQSFPGVNVQEEDGFGLYTNIGIRGTSLERSTKVTLLEDGIPIAPAPYSAPAAYYIPILARMKGIEVIKGPNQYKYGPNTVGGTINFISSTLPTEFTSQVVASGGSWNTKVISAKIGDQVRNISYLVEANNIASDGFKQLVVNNTRQFTGLDRKNILIKARIKALEKNKIYRSITVKYNYNEDFSTDSYIGLFPEDFNANPYMRYPSSQYTKMNARHRQFAIFYNSLPNEKLEINASFYLTKFRRNWYDLAELQLISGDTSYINVAEIYENPEKYNELVPIIKGEKSSQDTLLVYRNNIREYYNNGLRIDFKLRLPSNHPQISHQLRWGTIFQFDGISQYLNNETFRTQKEVLSLTYREPKGYASNILEQTFALNYYVEYHFTYGRLKVIPVIRGENIDKARNTYTANDTRRIGENSKNLSRQLNKIFPGFAANYDLNENLNIFTSLYQGFTPPSIATSVNPEISINYEVGGKFFKDNYIVEGAFFLNNYKNLLGSRIDVVGGQGSLDLFNAGPAKAWGIELFGTTEYFVAHWKNMDIKMPLSLSYTYTEAFFLSSFTSNSIVWQEVSAGDNIPYIPRHQVLLSLGIESQKFMLSLRNRYQGAMWTRPGKGSMRNERFVIPFYYTMDISAKIKLTKRADAIASFSNVFNRKYIISDLPAGLRAGRPRMLRLGISMSF